MKLKIGLVLLLLLLNLALSARFSAAQNAKASPAARPESNQASERPWLWQTEDLTTPQQIDRAFQRGEIDEEQRLLYLAYALGDYGALPVQYRGNAPWSGTAVLRELQHALTSPESTLSTATADAIRGILQEATFSPNGVAADVRETEHFRIEYGAIGGGLTIDDYADSLEQTWQTVVDQFGWAAPPSYPPNPVPGDLYLVRVMAFGDPNQLGFTTISSPYAGLVYDNPHTTWDDFDAYASVMALSNDFSRAYSTSQQMMDGTIAHEFTHAIHYGYGVLSGTNHPDMIFIEGGANWIVDEVFDDSDLGNRKLWPYFDRCMGQHDGDPYFYWLTFRGLTERYGVGVPGGGEQVMQDFLEITSRSRASNMLPALDEALANKGSSLPEAFHDYAIALRFSKACPTAAPYCFEEAEAYVNAVGSIIDTGRILTNNGDYSGYLQDNYAINYVGLPLREQYALEFENLSEGGEFRVSIVADLGDDLQITELPGIVAGNGKIELPFYAPPEEARRVAAVITNQQQTADNPTSCASNPYALRARPVSVPLADVSVTQAPLPDPVSPGAELNYVITVNNVGPAPASDVTITDTLPANTTFLGASKTCTEQSAKIECFIGELPPNSPQQLTLTVKTPDSQTADLNNRVEVTAAEFDPLMTNNVSVNAVRLVHRSLLPYVSGR